MKTKNVILTTAALALSYFALVLGLTAGCPVFAADHTLTYTGLNSDAAVVGVDATDPSAPLVTRDNYTITAWGDTSGAYDNTYFLIMGIRATNLSVDIQNSGNITLTAIGGTASGSGDATARVHAQGLKSNNGTGTSIDSSIFNTGNISVSVTGGTATSTSGVALAGAFSKGIYSVRTTDVYNTGSIFVSAFGGTATGTAASSGSTVTNANANAYGVCMQNSGKVTNLGDITVTATGGTAAGPNSEALAQAFGIWAQSSGTITNSGNIYVTATGGSALSDAQAAAYGIWARNSGDIVNTGDITVRATPGTANGSTDTATAHGIYIYGDTTLTSTGTIRAYAATQAYEVYVASGTTTLKDAYKLTLDGESATGSLYIASGATLDINDAVLSLATGSDFSWDTAYAVFDNAGTVSGSFSSVSAANPNVTLSYGNQGTATSADDTVSLSYTPTVSAFGESFGVVLNTAGLTGRLMDGRMAAALLDPGLTAGNGSSPLYADSGTVASDAYGGYSMPSPRSGSRFFWTPYAANSRKQASPTGYTADTGGLTAGWERTSGRGAYGFHLGMGLSRVYYSGRAMDGNRETQHLCSAGLHAMGARENWTWQGRITGFAGHSDYKGLTGADLKMTETADIDTFGINASLSGGHMFRLGRHILLPRAGLDYTGAHHRSFTTSAEEESWNVQVAGENIHQTSALANLSWKLPLQKEDLTITPFLAAGLRYLLSDETMDSSQSVSGGTPTTLTSSRDRLSGTLSASLRFNCQNRLSSEIAYAGEYGETAASHSIWVGFVRAL